MEQLFDAQRNEDNQDNPEYSSRFLWYKKPYGSNSYRISSLDDFIDFINIVNKTNLSWGINQTNFCGSTVTLTEDIDLSEFCKNNKWSPISAFAGTFDGQNHQIRNLTVDSNDNGGLMGLFGSLETGGIIKTLNLLNVQIYCSCSKVGALAGRCQGIIEGCVISADKVSSSNNGSCVGGIVGELESGFVYGCCFSGDYVSGKDAGGVVGKISSSVVTVCSSACKEIKASVNAGGIGGYQSDSVITSCLCRLGAIKATPFGGIIGCSEMFFNPNAEVSYSYCYWSAGSQMSAVGLNKGGIVKEVGSKEMVEMNTSYMIDVLNEAIIPALKFYYDKEEVEVKIYWELIAYEKSSTLPFPVYKDLHILFDKDSFFRIDKQKEIYLKPYLIGEIYWADREEASIDIVDGYKYLTSFKSGGFSVTVAHTVAKPYQFRTFGVAANDPFVSISAADIKHQLFVYGDKRYLSLYSSGLFTCYIYKWDEVKSDFVRVSQISLGAKGEKIVKFFEHQYNLYLFHSQSDGQWKISKIDAQNMTLINKDVLKGNLSLGVKDVFFVKKGFDAYMYAIDCDKENGSHSCISYELKFKANKLTWDDCWERIYKEFYMYEWRKERALYVDDIRKGEISGNMFKPFCMGDRYYLASISGNELIISGLEGRKPYQIRKRNLNIDGDYTICGISFQDGSLLIETVNKETHKFYRYPIKMSDNKEFEYRLSDWMDDLRPVIGDTEYRQIKTPATHNSGSFDRISLSGPLCQSLGILDQLKCGVRYFDIRLTKTVSSKEGIQFYMHHNSKYSKKQSFAQALKVVKTFSESHPGEFIILNLRKGKEKSLEDVDMSYLYDLIYKELSDSIYECNDQNKTLIKGNFKLNDLLNNSNKQRVMLVFREDKLAEFWKKNNEKEKVEEKYKEKYKNIYWNGTGFGDRNFWCTGTYNADIYYRMRCFPEMQAIDVKDHLLKNLEEQSKRNNTLFDMDCYFFNVAEMGSNKYTAELAGDIFREMIREDIPSDQMLYINHVIFDFIDAVKARYVVDLNLPNGGITVYD